MNLVKKIDENLNKAIDDVVANKEKYVKNPGIDFTRNRKLPMQDVMKQILTMNGGSLKKELYDWSQINKTTLTASAFVQQRSKISNAAFRDVFNKFNANCKDTKTYCGYRVLGVDGTVINCPRNPKSPYFLSSSISSEGINQIHLNAIYDICNKVYVDVELQSRLQCDERDALAKMLKRIKSDEKYLIITDRGYESFNMFAHFIDTPNVDFLCRVRQEKGAIREIREIPMRECDIDISIEITTSQTNEDKKLGRHFIQTGSKNGKINSDNTRISRWDFPSPYTLNFRVVRILLDNGEYETLATSLPREEFPLKQLKNLYHMRWDIETSFRDLKYVIGLTHLHSKKDELIIQEIFAAITMYNYCSRISNNIVISKNQKCKYAYKVNFCMAIHLCKLFCRSHKKNFSILLDDISRYTEPVRPGRKDKRKMRAKRFEGFIYRVAA